jgi:hypothetical protein
MAAAADVPQVPQVVSAPSTPVLYQADWSGSLAGWSGTADWKVLGGMLINDGTRNLSRIIAPYRAPTPDYTIEAEIQMVRGGFFSLTVRMDDRNSLVDANFSDGRADIWAQGDGAALTQRPFNVGGGWHTYRFEATGNRFRVFVDGSPGAEATDNRYISGTQAGLSANAQINVRSFTVTAL